ncbi:pyridoxal phosphate-dependent aminotransferase [Aeromicrobium sp. CF4.19]|uniref:pyridoxal phosphate-dependent aminotransferase n=1 Tax=Aeromicrobium sp. CF4.19 TaxID=3373082 RepID=UPI003EE48FEA
MAGDVDDTPSYHVAAGMRRVMGTSLRTSITPAGAGAVSLAVGEPGFATPPGIVEAMNAALAAGYTHYPDSSGDPELRSALADETGGGYGLEDIAITHGGCGGLTASILATVSPGDRVIIPQPTYSLYGDLVQLAGGEPVYVPLDRSLHLDLDAVASALDGTRLIILCNPGNPTGAVIPGPQLEQLADLLNGTDVLVLVDEAYADLVYDGTFVPSSRVEALRPRLLVCTTFSKSFAMTGWRLGSVAGPSELMPAVRAAHRTINGGVNAAVQRAGLYAVRNRAALVAPYVDEYRRRRDRLMELLEGQEGLRFERPEGAFYLFARYDGNQASVDLVRELEARGIRVRPGREFGPAGEGNIRISYSVDMETLEEGAGRLLAALASLR